MLLSRRIAGVVSTTLLAVIIVAPQFFLPQTIALFKDGDYFTEANLRSHRVLKEISKIDDIHEFRVVFEDSQLSRLFWSMNAIYYGLRTFQGYMNPLPNRQYRELFHVFNSKNYLNLLGAKYYVCRPCNLLPLSDFTLVSEIEGFRVYATEKVRPRYFVTNQIADTYGDMGEFWSKLKKSDDYLQKVFIHANDFSKLSSWFGPASSQVDYQILTELGSQNSLQIVLKSNSRAMLVLNEYFNRDWNVKLNGESQRPIKVNLNQMGILLPKGINQVHFEYFPVLFVWLTRVRWVVGSILSCYLLVFAYSNRNEITSWFREKPEI